MQVQITQPDTRVVSIKVNHMKNHDNSDIKIVKIEDGTTIFLTQNFGSFFPNITEYYVMGVKLQYITRRDFRGIENIESLSFYGNSIEEIPEDAFFDLKKLKFLSLALNKIATIPLLLFYSLCDLEEITLRGNSIESFPSFVFANNKQLSGIYLSNNRITSFSSDLVLKVPKLKEINLSSNTCINNNFNFEVINDDDLKHEISLYVLSQCYLNNNFNFIVNKQCETDLKTCKNRVESLLAENKALEDSKKS